MKSCSRMNRSRLWAGPGRKTRSSLWRPRKPAVFCDLRRLWSTTDAMKIAKKAHKLADAFQVRHAGSFRLKDFDPADIRGIQSKEKADELLQQSVAVLQDLQEKLYAQDQWAVLLIFQA